MVLDLGDGGETEAFFKARQFTHLDLVHVVIATHQQQPNLPLVEQIWISTGV
jgi:hypothetical protein